MKGMSETGVIEKMEDAELISKVPAVSSHCAEAEKVAR